MIQNFCNILCIFFFQFICSGHLYIDGLWKKNPLPSMPNLNCYIESTTNFHYSHPIANQLGFPCPSMHLPFENGGTVKKHAFNPLSEPFHPMRNSYSSTHLSASISSSVVYKNAMNSFATENVDFNALNSCESSKFLCILCSKKFTTFDKLVQHIKNKVQQPHACHICGVSYKHDYLLQRHLENRRSLKSFKCHACYKKFRSINQLRKHFTLCRYKLYLFT